MKIRFNELRQANLIVDAIYEGGPNGGFSADPVQYLMECENQGGFRKRGTTQKGIVKLHYVVLTSTQKEEEWKDTIDDTTGILVYHGDNSKENNDIHDTRKKGNLILRHTFDLLQQGNRRDITPFFVFFKSDKSNVIFKGLAVPGSNTNIEELRVVKQGKNKNINNYEATFTILDISEIDRRWLTDLVDGNGLESSYVPKQWLNWVNTGEYVPRIKDVYKEQIRENDEQYIINSNEDFDQQVSKARKLSNEELKRRINECKPRPIKKQTTSVVYDRNPYVVAAVLNRANGICEECGKPAPFIRVSDNTPYLEVHHKVRLADGGLDTIENTVALCPNCHRKMHYGISED